MQLLQPCPSNHRTYRTSAKRIQVVIEHRRIQRNPTKRIQVITEYTEHGRTRSPPTKRIQVIREPCKTISNNHRTHKHGHTRRNPTKRIQVITEHRRTCRNHTKWIQAITEHRRTQKPTKRTEVITEHAEHRRTRNNPTKRSNHRTHKIRTRTQKPYTTNSVRALLSSGLMICLRSINQVTSVEAGQELLSLSRYWRRSRSASSSATEEDLKGTFTQGGVQCPLVWIQFYSHLSRCALWSSFQRNLHPLSVCIYIFNDGHKFVYCNHTIPPYPCYPPPPFPPRKTVSDNSQSRS